MTGNLYRSRRPYVLYWYSVSLSKNDWYHTLTSCPPMSPGFLFYFWEFRTLGVSPTKDCPQDFHVWTQEYFFVLSKLNVCGKVISISRPQHRILKQRVRRYGNRDCVDEGEWEDPGVKIWMCFDNTESESRVQTRPKRFVGLVTHTTSVTSVSRMKWKYGSFEKRNNQYFFFYEDGEEEFLVLL